MTKTKTQHSTEYNITMALCKEYNRDIYERVQHPVRKENMMVYSAINDLLTTYGWMPSRIGEWLKYAQRSGM